MSVMISFVIISMYYKHFIFKLKSMNRSVTFHNSSTGCESNQFVSVLITEKCSLNHVQ